MNRYYYNISIAAEAIQANKLKSVLTALGIIFGVAAVISMLAIGNGARQEILEQMKMVGVNNIIIKPLQADTRDKEENGNRPKKYSPGLTLYDAQSIRIIPDVLKVTPLISQSEYVIRDGKRRKASLLGVSSDYFSLFSLAIEQGNLFNHYQEEHGLPVCLISQEFKIRFFSAKDPVGQRIKCGNVWLTIVGVTQSRNISEEMNKLGLAGGADAIYIPVKTMLLRYINRSLVTTKDFKTSGNEDEKVEETDRDYNQLDQIIVQISESEKIPVTVGVIKRMLSRKHLSNEDFEIIVPELLLKQQQRTKDIFNIVLGAIAAISLIVGGIGIMNIMLASVMERIKEIGIRRAMGATRKDIVFQFISESALISIIGGFIGIFAGYLLAYMVTRFSGVITIVSPASVIVAFVISASVGILFGIMPARKAAQQDPVVSLRTE